MNQETTNWGHWYRIFRQRADRSLPPLEADLDYTRLPRSLARSMAVFQLGESGGGSIVEQAKTSKLPGLNADYADAVALFVAEEHRHANLLAVSVRLMGGKLLTENWTAQLFVFGRRLFGLRLKILVLLAAEVVGLCYYQLVASRLPPCRLRDWLLEIVSDEQDHLRFHCQFLRSQTDSRFKRRIFLLSWRFLMWLSEHVVLIDHRAALRDLHLEREEVRASWARHRQKAEALVLGDIAAELADARPNSATGIPCNSPEAVSR